LVSSLSDGPGAPARADRPNPPARSESETVATDDDDAVIPRIALARATRQVPEVAAADLPELTLDAGSPVPALVRRWGYEAEADIDCSGLSELGLDCERVKSRWSDLRLLDRPVALRLQLDGDARYVLVTALDEEYAILQRGERLGRVPIATLDERWSGDVLMLWRIPPGGARMIGPGTAGEAVRWLREQLAALPDAPLSDVTSPVYDSDLREAVRAFQAGRGLAVDGIAGPRTLVMLNNALADNAIPRLSQSPVP
jgi:general secretion pathway protein A